MEPISVIIGALSSAATQGMVHSFSQGVGQEVYQDLKALIRKKFGGDTKAEMILEEHEQDPETFEKPLEKKLVEAGVDQDEEILKIAKKLLDTLNKLEGEQASKGETNNLQFQTGRDVKGIAGRVSSSSITQGDFN